MTNDSKRFKWTALGAGLADPLNGAKALVIFFWQIIIVVLVCSIAWGVFSIFKMYKPVPPTPDIVTAETANIDKSSTTVNVTELPLSNWFGFGSRNKTNNN